MCCPEIDLELAVDLLVGAYAWNYRLAAAQGADAPTGSPRYSIARSG